MVHGGHEPRATGEYLDGGESRWVTVGVKGQDDVSISLFKRADGFQEKIQDGLIFQTDDCRKNVADLKARGAKITLDAAEQPWGVQAFFEDTHTATPT